MSKKDKKNSRQDQNTKDKKETYDYGSSTKQGQQVNNRTEISSKTVVSSCEIKVPAGFVSALGPGSSVPVVFNPVGLHCIVYPYDSLTVNNVPTPYGTLNNCSVNINEVRLVGSIPYIVHLPVTFNNPNYGTSGSATLSCTDSVYVNQVICYTGSNTNPYPNLCNVSASGVISQQFQCPDGSVTFSISVTFTLLS